MSTIIGSMHKITKKSKANIACTKCAQQELLVSYLQEYFHFLGLPLFPTGRIVDVTCHNCGHSVDPATNSQLANEVKAMRPMIPLWSYLGMILALAITIAVGVSIYLSAKEAEALKQHNIEYINDPNPGDIYIMRSHYGDIDTQADYFLFRFVKKSPSEDTQDYLFQDINPAYYINQGYLDTLAQAKKFAEDLLDNPIQEEMVELVPIKKELLLVMAHGFTDLYNGKTKIEMIIRR